MKVNNINNSCNLTPEKLDQIERGKRIKYIRENELHMNKTQLAKEIGISGQFLGLVEDGKGNLVYRSIKKLRHLSGHSADYDAINETKELLNNYSDSQIVDAINIIKSIALSIKSK